MRIVRTPKELKSVLDSWRSKGDSVGFVPTLGALHEGHAALIRCAQKQNRRVIVSVFVNPLQFGPREDYKRYPRNETRDASLCRRWGADLYWGPQARRILRPGAYRRIKHDRSLTRTLCGPFRPGHFDGVVTIVHLFMAAIRPDRLYLGLKDYQQWRVIQKMSKKRFGSQIRVVGVPTVREKDGLALSSRNRYLTPSERRYAPVIYKALRWARKSLRAGEAPGIVERELKRRLEAPDGFKVQYAEVVDSQSLRKVIKSSPTKGRRLLVATAVLTPSARLIDNILV